MILYNISVKMYEVISSMYSNIKSCVSYNNTRTDYFSCDNGVKQGENFKPFLFSLFLNDLEEFLINKNVTSLNSVSDDVEKELDIYIKIFIN